MDEIKLPEPGFNVTKTGRVFSRPDEVDCTDRAMDVYTADQLRAAVEADRMQRQPGQPVAFVKPHGATVKLEWASVDAAHNAIPGPLYAEQPARKPLTDEQIYGLYRRAWLETYHPRDDVVQRTYDRCINYFARAIEKAHGIGAKND